MFTGLTRQEQRTLFLLLVIIVGGLAVHQWRGQSQPESLVIDAAEGEVLVEPPSMASGPTAGGSAPAEDLIDLNNATVTELTSLPSIGEVRAQSIIAFREAHGPFARVEDLVEIHGIGEGILARVRPHVTVAGGPPPAVAPAETPPTSQPLPAQLPAASAGLINVNTAGIDELMELPGIGEVLAQRIIEHRHAHGPFQRPEDLLEISRIGPRTVERLSPLITF